MFYFPYIGNFIIPTDELIFFRGVGPGRSTTNLLLCAIKLLAFPISSCRAPRQSGSCCSAHVRSTAVQRACSCRSWSAQGDLTMQLGLGSVVTIVLPSPISTARKQVLTVFTVPLLFLQRFTCFIFSLMFLHRMNSYDGLLLQRACWFVPKCQGDPGRQSYCVKLLGEFTHAVAHCCLVFDAWTAARSWKKRREDGLRIVAMALKNEVN